VVNLILDNQMRGLRVLAQGGQTSRGDYDNHSFSVTWGGDLGERSSLLLSGEVSQAQGIRGYASRDWFRSWAAISNPDPDGPKEVIVRNAHATGFTYGGLITSGPLAGIQFLEGGVPAPFIAGAYRTGQTQSGGSGVDPAADQVWILPDQQHYSGLAKFTTQLAPELALDAQLMFGRSDSRFQKYPPSLWGSWEATIFSDNVFLPEYIRRRMAETGISSFRLGRMANGDMGEGNVLSRNAMLSGTAGMQWQLGRWSVDAYAQAGRNENLVRYADGLRLDRVYRAIDSVPDANGNPVCRSTLTFPDDGCVPLNLFGQGSVSQAARDYVTEGYEEQLQDVHEQVAEATAQGDLLQLPAGALTVAAGASWRRESVHSRPRRYPESLDGMIVGPAADYGYRGLPRAYLNNIAIFEGTSSRSVKGRYSVWETFGEAVVPVVAARPFIERIELNGALRFADYSGSGGIAAWKAGLDWQIGYGLRLRATRSRDVRAGSLSERYDQSSSGTTIVDKLQAGEPAYAITALLAGNPEVEPEKADTTTAGIVYRPRALPEYSMSIDYYDIRIHDAIGLLGVQKIIDDCSTGDEELCGLIERDTGSGTITQVRNLVKNVADARSRGIDLEMSWRKGLQWFGGAEALQLRAFFNRTLESLSINGNGVRVDRAGQTGLGGGAPRWQASVSAIYTRDGFRAALQERMISDGQYSAVNGPGDIDDNSVSGAAYTNLRLSWQHGRNSGLTLFLNVNNLFDRDPPRVADWGFGGSMPTNESLFDVLGRRFVLGFQLER
jgi:outer membrane receptor protein involved in Fe transport